MSIMNIDVRAQIYLVSLWNIIVMMLVMFCGASLANLTYDRETDPYGSSEDDPIGSAMKADKRKHFTYIYNTFVFLQLFNMINCRKIGKKDFNVFEEFFHNMYFLVLFVFIAVVQYLQSNIAFFSSITNCEYMERSEWGSCIAVGSTTLLISALIKVIPETWIRKLPLIEKGDKLEDTPVKNRFMDKFVELQQAPKSSDAPGSALNSEGIEQPLIQNDGDDAFKQV
jgi:magnesium-transporting ATPase (P-type)